MKDLTLSQIERQNVLNNRFAVAIIQEHLGLEAIYFNGQYWLTKKMVADFYEVEERTIERYIAQNEEELNHNGYILSKGKLLKELKLQFAHVINVGSKTTQLAFLASVRSLTLEWCRLKHICSMQAALSTFRNFVPAWYKNSICEE